jgi:hypothetical protein
MRTIRRGPFLSFSIAAKFLVPYFSSFHFLFIYLTRNYSLDSSLHRRYGVEDIVVRVCGHPYG